MAQSNTENDLPVKVQLVFQGGGAKLCDLLAAAEAVQKLIEERKIIVTRIAGTSAGAIVACLLGSGEPIGRVRERLASNGKRHLSKIQPKRSKIRLLWRAIAGKPVFESQPLKNFFAEMFRFDERRYERLGDLKVAEVIITASDMLNGEKVVYRASDKRIVDALFDSCALPYVFKSVKSGGSIVDGGICENLPTKELMEHREKDGKIFAFSFARDAAPAEPGNSLTYGLALLETAMSNSVNRAVSEIGHGQVFHIETDITTFAFEEALDRGLKDDHYLRVRDQSYSWLRDVTNLLRIDPEPTVVDEPDDSASAHKVMENIHRVYMAHHHMTPVRYERSQIEVTAWPLLADHRRNSTYHIHHRVTFRPLTEKVHCVRLGLFSDGTNMVKGLVTGIVRDAHGNKVNTTIIPTSVPVDLQEDPLKLRRYLLFFFDEPLDPEDQAKFPYTLELHDYVEGCLDGLAEGNYEQVTMTSDRTLIEEVDIVVYLPDNYNGIRMYTYESQSESETCIAGAPIRDHELANSRYNPDAGFIAVGWRGKNLQLGETFGAVLAPRR